MAITLLPVKLHLACAANLAAGRPLWSARCCGLCLADGHAFYPVTHRSQALERACAGWPRQTRAALRDCKQAHCELSAAEASNRRGQGQGWPAPLLPGSGVRAAASCTAPHTNASSGFVQRPWWPQSDSYTSNRSRHSPGTRGQGSVSLKHLGIMSATACSALAPWQ